MPAADWPGGALLFVAHPGHELRVHTWLGRARPSVWVLTDGSARLGCSRLAATERILARQGATPGRLFGGHTDAWVYGEMLAGRHAVFLAAVDLLVETVERESIGTLAGDAAEGFNPVHDVCRLVLNAATELLRRRGQTVANLEFPLHGHPGALGRPGSVVVHLDERELEAKLAAAGEVADLAEDLAEGLQRHGRAAFATEVLSPARFTGPADGLAEETPFYERHGEQRVRSGKYGVVLRRRQHLLPMAAALARHVEERCR